MLATLGLSALLFQGPPNIEVAPSDAAEQPIRSDDGSAELDALRRRGQRDELSAGEVDPEGTRGLEFDYGVALDGSVAEDDPAAAGTGPIDHDVIGEADRSLVQRKGRRRVLAGFWMIFSGALVGPACLAGAVSGGRQGQTTPAIVLGSVAVVGFGLLGGGIPLVIRGRKMSKHPDQFVRIEQVPKLVLTPSGGGFALRF